MIPLILLALGLGAALTVYELSPRTRSRVDSYVRAIRSANVAHQTADAHLATAARHAQQADVAKQVAQQQQQQRQPTVTPTPVQQPPYVPWVPMQPPYVPWVPSQPYVEPTIPTPMIPTPTIPAPTIPTPTIPTPTIPTPTIPTIPTQTAPEPVPVPPAPMPVPPVPPAPFPPAVPAQDVAEAQTDVAVDHTVAANEANQDAAKNTADAAQNAQSDAEKQAAADSAAKVLERERQIAEALRTLGVGQCGVRTYPRVTERAKNALLAKLRTEGMGVTGDNPWNIDTRQYNVKLRAVWDPRASVVKLIVTTGRGGLAGLVTCEEIWKKIDPIMKEVVR